jgi:hypothetical protein
LNSNDRDEEELTMRSMTTRNAMGLVPSPANCCAIALTRAAPSGAATTPTGEPAFCGLIGGARESVRQQAQRGLFQAALARGDRAVAKAQLERVLGAAALGRGPAEHWAHAEYGWMCFEDGDLQVPQPCTGAGPIKSSECSLFVLPSRRFGHVMQVAQVRNLPCWCVSWM